MTCVKQLRKVYNSPRNMLTSSLNYLMQVQKRIRKNVRNQNLEDSDVQWYGAVDDHTK